jgi:pimeloyl-ACP methyl ester carboxylesterase
VRPLPQVDGVEHRHVDLGGLRLHVAEAGGGDPLLLVHGWPQHWFEWRRLIPELAGRYRVICPDLRGFGWSDAPPGRYEKETLARDLLGLLDALGLDRVRLVGHDWGGFTGFLACLRAPERFERFAALSIVTPWFRPALSLATLRGVAYQSAIIAPLLGRRIAAHPAFVRTLFRRGSSRRAAWTSDELATYADQFREPERASATVALYRSFQLLEVWPMAFGRYADRRLTVPTLAMYGEHDPVVRASAFKRAESHADSLRVERIAGAGHFLPEEVPEVVLERLVPFLAASDAGP